MGGHLKRLTGDVAVYGSGKVALQLLAFATLPVLTRTFSTGQYGAIETINTVSSVLTLVAVLGLDSASQRSYFDYPPEQVEQRRSVLATAGATLACWSLTLGLALAATSEHVSQWLFGSPRYATAILLAGVALPVLTGVTFVLEVLRLQHKPVRYVVLSVGAGALSAGLTVLWVLKTDAGIEGVFAAVLTGNLVALLAGLTAVLPALRGRPSAHHLRVMLAFGLPLVPVAAATWVVQLADRFFLLALADPAAVGIYSLAAKFANLLMLPVTALAVAWSPFFLGLHQRDAAEERRVRAEVLTLVTAALTWGAVAVTAASFTFFATFTGDEFQDAYQAVAPLVVGVVAIGLNVILMSGISLARRTGYFVRYTAYAAAVNVALNFALIPRWGVMGAAVATTLTQLCLCAMYAWRAQRLDPVRFDWAGVARIALLGLVLITPAAAWHSPQLWLEMTVKTVIVLAFPVFVLVSGVLGEPRTAQLRRVLRDLARRRTITR